jgi:hypothetical protein
LDNDLQVSYSMDEGATFKPIGANVKLAVGWWKGARSALLALTVGA